MRLKIEDSCIVNNLFIDDASSEVVKYVLIEV